jgi:threonine dehydrogenase-like Zn-dependent dehydrogenase
VSETKAPARVNLRWAHRGDPLHDLLDADPEAVPLPAPSADEVIARVEAVSICSSDIKVVRMGMDHPLLAKAEGGGDTVLGHEMSLRVQEIGSAQAGRFRPGQRLALQPAMRIDGKRRIIGFDVPGGFAQYLRLGPEVLADYVFDAPEELTAAEIALLEPYGCVEHAYRPNARQGLAENGSALVVLGLDCGRYRLPVQPPWKQLVVAEANDADPAGFLGSAERRISPLAELTDERFDDIVALGEIHRKDLERLPGLLAERGLLLQARQTRTEPVIVDAARVHYDALSFVGTTEPDILSAFAPGRQRFDVRPGGVVLVHGAGGAMGRIHVHRLLQLENGPATVIATSRKGQRLADLESDFGPMAEAQDRNLIVTDTDNLAQVIKGSAPRGLDDAVVVAPDADVVAETAKWLAPHGLLAVFAGFAYGKPLPFDLSGVAVSGKRLTGSTGCSIEDMTGVLARVMAGELDLLANLKAVGGLKALPQALDAVSRGTLSGKIVIYPQAPDMPFRTLEGGWGRAEENGLTRPPQAEE